MWGQAFKFAFLSPQGENPFPSQPFQEGTLISSSRKNKGFYFPNSESVHHRCGVVPVALRLVALRVSSAAEAPAPFAAASWHSQSTFQSPLPKITLSSSVLAQCVRLFATP